MAEQTMVERVARAMWEVRRNFMAELHPDFPHLRLEEWGDGRLPSQNGIMEEARAAIEAIEVDYEIVPRTKK